MAQYRSGFLVLEKELLDNMLEVLPARALKIYMVILRHAAYKGEETLYEGHPVHIEPGDLITSLRRLETISGESKSAIEHDLPLLRKHGMIRIHHMPRHTHISVVNYHRFQGQKSAKNKGQTTSGQLSGQDSRQLELGFSSTRTIVSEDEHKKSRQLLRQANAENPDEVQIHTLLNNKTSKQGEENKDNHPMEIKKIEQTYNQRIHLGAPDDTSAAVFLEQILSSGYSIEQIEGVIENYASYLLKQGQKHEGRGKRIRWFFAPPESVWMQFLEQAPIRSRESARAPQEVLLPAGLLQAPDVWRAALESLSKEIDQENYSAWISCLIYLGHLSGTLYISAPSILNRSWVLKNYEQAIISAFANVKSDPSSHHLTVEFLEVILEKGKELDHA